MLALGLLFVLGALAIWANGGGSDSQAATPVPETEEEVSGDAIGIEDARSPIRVVESGESVPEPMPWHRPLGELPIEGRTYGDILRDWHGDRWDDLVERHGVPAFLDRVCDLESLGEPEACLDGEVLRIVLGLFDAHDRSMLWKRFGTIVTFGDACGGAEQVLKAAARSEEFNPGLPELESQGPAWEAAVQSIEQEVIEFRSTALESVEEARSAIERDLDSLSAYSLPKRGLLLFAPFWGPPHPRYGHTSAKYGQHLYFSGGDPASSCSTFVFSYSLDLHLDSGMLESLARLADSKEVVSLRLKNAINALPR